MRALLGWRGSGVRISGEFRVRWVVKKHGGLVLHLQLCSFAKELEKE